MSDVEASGHGGDDNIGLPKVNNTALRSLSQLFALSFYICVANASPYWFVFFLGHGSETDRR
jgi:hypothetical protein